MRSSHLDADLVYCDHLDLTPSQIRSLKKFLTSRRSQLDLQNRCDINEILHEIYERRMRALSVAKVIQFPLSWSKTTGFRCLLEEKRKLDKISLYEPNLLAEKAAVDESDLEDSNIYLTVGTFSPRYLWEVLDSLQVEQRRLFELKYLHDWSWQKITELLREKEPNLTEVAVRQRGHQLRKKLRELVLARLKRSCNEGQLEKNEV